MLLVNQVITDAWYFSGIVPRGLDTVEGDQMTDGLRLLNYLLSERALTAKYIPYYGHTSVTTIIDQEDYFVPNLIVLDTLTFNIDTIRFPMERKGRRDYWGTGRPDNIDSILTTYYVERVNGGSNIYLYFKPSEPFPINITGKFALTNVALGQDLELTVELNYCSYLTLLLAKRICAFNLMSTPAETLRQLAEVEQQLADINPMDFSQKRRSVLTKGTTGGWAYANIGRGMIP